MEKRRQELGLVKKEGTTAKTDRESRTQAECELEFLALMVGYIPSEEIEVNLEVFLGLSSLLHHVLHDVKKERE